MDFLNKLFGKKQDSQQTPSDPAFAEDIRRIRALAEERNFAQRETIQAFIGQSLVRIQDSSYKNGFPLKKNDVTAWSLHEDINDSLSFIIDTIKQMEEKSVPHFVIIATTDSSVSNKCNEAIVASGYKSSEIACILAETTNEEKIKLKEKVMLGEFRFLIADGYLLDSDFYLGTMENAIPAIKLLTGAKTDKQFQVVLLVINAIAMKTLQIRRSVEMLENSFTAKDLIRKRKLARDTIIMTAFDAAKANKKMLSGIHRTSNNTLTIDVVKNNISDSVQENDCQELNKVIKLISSQSDESTIWALIESAIHYIEPIATSSDVVPKFKEQKTKNPSEAARILIREAVATIQPISDADVRSEYKNIMQTWASQKLYSGTPDQIERLVRVNLEEIAKFSGFKDIQVKTYEDQRCAQASAYFTSSFIGIRVWRTNKSLFVCGNSVFHDV
ncbi:MAG TPA: hypothetical protein VI423_05190 [Paenisporosarcina sp.]|nr:hypothetical protein [Paenisporosarcina sp.]